MYAIACTSMSTVCFFKALELWVYTKEKTNQKKTKQNKKKNNLDGQRASHEKNMRSHNVSMLAHGCHVTVPARQLPPTFLCLLPMWPYSPLPQQEALNTGLMSHSNPPALLICTPAGSIGRHQTNKASWRGSAVSHLFSSSGTRRKRGHRPFPLS